VRSSHIFKHCDESFKMCRPAPPSQGETCMRDKSGDVKNGYEMAGLAALGLIGILAGIVGLVLANS
jgi:hypothetical protein